MNRCTKAELADIHFIYDLANGNGHVGIMGKYIQRGGKRIMKRSIGCIKTWWSIVLSEPRLTINSKIDWWHEYPSLLLRSVKLPVCHVS
ncbi:hypothetical protein TNCV_2542021 [Trichonephila clavipes]|nr:hypothetical protein TNCV_2542021 [Trichonephila clavipes]